MLARLCRLFIALELAFYGAMGVALHFAFGWGAARIAAGALLLAFGSRLALVCFTALVGWLAGGEREPGHRIGAAATARYLLQEYAALLLDNFIFLPLESLAVRPDPPLAASLRTPVILVHGYMSNRGYFGGLARAIERAGLGPVYTPNFPVLLASIEHFADALHQEVERIANGCAQSRVILVGYSMGGLAAREYLRRRGTARIARLVTIGSPHHGTILASMGLGLNARQMHRGSDFLLSLEASESAAPPAVDAVCIWSPHDNLVAPPHTSLLAWARSVALPGIGHVAIIDSPRTFAAVTAELSR